MGYSLVMMRVVGAGDGRERRRGVGRVLHDECEIGDGEDAHRRADRQGRPVRRHRAPPLAVDEDRPDGRELLPHDADLVFQAARAGRHRAVARHDDLEDGERREGDQRQREGDDQDDGHRAPRPLRQHDQPDDENHQPADRDAAVRGREELRRKQGQREGEQHPAGDVRAGNIDRREA